ncbi:MAG: FecR family protein [Candidatus Sumerlaeaceae bacterium]|nr:FecR family protein [Candidatus Sumerlaeaceae bacterium]
MTNPNPMNNPVEPIEPAVLKALYDNPAQPPANDATQSAAGLRDNLNAWANEPASADLRGRFRKAILLESESAPAETSVVPVGGTTWLRRAGTRSLAPVTSILPVQAGSSVVVPAGSRAQIHYADGSLLLLDGGTELRVGARAADGEAARLRNGRLFAWIAPQSSGRFAIRTPQGQVAVLGTEFDLASIAGRPLDLLVAGGRVRFTPRTATAGIAPTPTEVGAGQWLSFNNGHKNVRQLNSRELGRRTAWARESGTGGGGKGGWIAVILALLIAAGAYHLYDSQSGSSPAKSTTPAAAAQSSGGALAYPAKVEGDTVTFQHPTQAGTAIRYRGDATQQGPDGKFVPESKVTMEVRVAEATPGGSSKIEVKLVNGDELEPNGNAKRRDPRGHLSSLIGTTVMVTSANGVVQGAEIPGKATINGSEAIFLADVLRYNLAALIPNIPVKPGQEWDANLSGIIPQHPGGKYNYQTHLKFDGFEGDGANRKARIVYTSTGNVEGLVMLRESRGGREFQVRMDQRKFNETGRILVNLATGRIELRELTETTTNELSRSTMNGTQVLQSTKLPNGDTRTRTVKIVPE